MSYNTEKPSPDAIRKIILSSREPLIFKGILKWDFLNWSLDKWLSVCKNEKMVFRCGHKTYTKEPQWERTTDVFEGNFKDFINFKLPNKWLYFDYKYLKEWLSEVDELKTISWDDFGFPEFTFEESTIWMGTKGAHTPCHIDTYGCNLIAQIYGTKQWLVFPPSEKLLPTRIPYEESSIYSKLNFFSPDIEKFKGINNGRCIILKPGDVLFLPHNWWHYVENLETAISINVWLPLECDDEKRLEEAITQMLVTQFVKDLSQEEKHIILNPNEIDNIKHNDLKKSFEMIKLCMDNLNNRNIKLSEDNKQEDQLNEDVVMKYSDYISAVPKMDNFQLVKFLELKKSTCTPDKGEKINISRTDCSDIIEAVTHPEVIHSIKSKLLFYR